MHAFRLASGLLLAVLVLVMRPREADAAPMMTQLATLRVEATTIVLGTMGPGLVLDVDTVVKGTSPLGPRKLVSPPEGSASATGRVVAFLDAKGTFRWVGMLLAGPTLETGVLHLSGFFDWNAHFVSPGVMTLAQLKDYLATGNLDQRWIATLVAADGRGGYVPTATSFTIDDAPLTHTTTMRGARPGACLDQVSISSTFGEGHPTIGLSGACPQRRLTLETTVSGVDTNGAITLDARPTAPFLDAGELGTYLSDPTFVDVARTLDVMPVGGGPGWGWQLGVGLVDPNGGLHPAGGASTQPSGANGSPTSTHVYEFAGATLSFVPRRTAAIGSGGDAASLVPLVDANDIASCVLRVPGQPERACTLGRGLSIVKRLP